MILRDTWIRIELLKAKASGIILPSGKEDVIDDEVAAFNVLAVGTKVEDVKVGDVVILMAAMGSLVRWKYLDEKFFATREADVVAIMNRHEGSENL